MKLIKRVPFIRMNKLFTHGLPGFTLPETNSSLLKMMVSNRNLLFQWSIFRGKLAVTFREGRHAAKDLLFFFRSG